MKRKLNFLVLTILILLIIFMSQVIHKLDKLSVIQNSDKIQDTSDNTQNHDSSSQLDISNAGKEIYSEKTQKENTVETADSTSATQDYNPSKTSPAVSHNSNDTTDISSQKTVAVLKTKEALRKVPAGSVIEVKELGDNLMDNCFYNEEIKGDIKKRIIGNSYKKDCTVPFEDLRYVRVLYYGFDKETHIGELIVNKEIASDIVVIFTELYESKYPIERMVLVDEYNADDNASMAANNTSSFNYRSVPGSTHLSRHALGLAIDINPLYNPYIQYTDKRTIILPEEGSKYADRTLDCPYYINEDDLCYKAFTKRGFTWGGFWETEPDFQHFQKSI